MLKKLNFLILVLFLILFLPCSKVKATDRGKLFRNGVVHVGQKENGKKEEINWLGTGFLVDDYCTFATAKHIFLEADKNKLVVRFQLPQDRAKVRTFGCRVLYEDPVKDLAFLKIDKLKSGSLHVFPLIQEFMKDSYFSEKVSIIGFPTISGKKKLDIPVIRDGVVASTEFDWDGKKMILLDLFGVPGFSGSPVILKEKGIVIGVVYGPGPTKRRFGFEWATPIDLGDYNRAISSDQKPER